MIIRPALFIKSLLLSVLVIALDQISKMWTVDFFTSHNPPFFVMPVFNLVLVHNKGVSFGMFNHEMAYMPLALTLLALLIACLLLAWLTRTTHALTGAALGLLIGGAIGNVIDRSRLSFVIDFLDFHAFGYHWPAFNIADSAVVCGAGLLLLQSLVFDKENRQSSST